jgi:hypothetical protein
MGVVLWHITMSLDGFIAGPDDAMEWVAMGSASSAAAARRRSGCGGPARASPGS